MASDKKRLDKTRNAGEAKVSFGSSLSWMTFFRFEQWPFYDSLRQGAIGGVDGYDADCLYGERYKVSSSSIFNHLYVPPIDVDEDVQKEKRL